MILRLPRKRGVIAVENENIMQKSVDLLFPYWLEKFPAIDLLFPFRSDVDNSYVFTILYERTKSSKHIVQPRCHFIIKRYKTEVLTDTSASVNVMDQCVYDAMPQKSLLQLMEIKVYDYGNPQPLTNVWGILAHFIFKDRSVTTLMYVVTNETDTLINFAASSALGLIQMI